MCDVELTRIVFTRSHVVFIGIVFSRGQVVFCLVIRYNVPAVSGIHLTCCVVQIDAIRFRVSSVGAPRSPQSDNNIGEYQISLFLITLRIAE